MYLLEGAIDYHDNFKKKLDMLSVCISVLSDLLLLCKCWDSDSEIPVIQKETNVTFTYTLMQQLAHSVLTPHSD